MQFSEKISVLSTVTDPTGWNVAVTSAVRRSNTSWQRFRRDFVSTLAVAYEMFKTCQSCSLRGFIQRTLSWARSGDCALPPLVDGLQGGVLEQSRGCGFVKRGCLSSQATWMGDFVFSVAFHPTQHTACETATYGNTRQVVGLFSFTSSDSSTLIRLCTRCDTISGGLRNRVHVENSFFHTVWCLIRHNLCFNMTRSRWSSSLLIVGHKEECWDISPYKISSTRNLQPLTDWGWRVLFREKAIITLLER